MTKINKEKMLEALSLSSIAFNDFLMCIGDAKTLESFLIKVLRKDALNKRNKRIIKRIHSRFNKVRAQEERKMLEDRQWYERDYN